MATYTLDWSETNLGGSAVVSYKRGTLLDFTDKPAGATSALSNVAALGAGDHILFELEVETSGSSLMTFDYKVSTESGWDKLHIDVDGVSQANYSGLVAWTSHPGISIASAGVHTIRFRYNKDAGDMNADRVWIALLNITNTVTVNDAAGTVDTYDMEDGTIPAFATTSTWINSTSEPIAGTRSLRTPTSPAHGGTYDLTLTKSTHERYRTIGFSYKVSTEAGWDKLQVFPDPLASSKIEFSGTTSGRLAIILPPAESSILVRYTKDGGGSAGSDAVWLDNIAMPAATGGATEVTGTASLTGGGALSATGKRTVVGSASMSGSGSLASSGKRTTAGTATLTGSGTLTTTGRRQVQGTATLNGGGALTATGDGSTPITEVIGSASLAGGGQLAATGKRTVIGSAALTGGGRLTASEIPFTPSPARMWTIPAEDRTYTIPAENRTYVIPHEDRTYTI